MRPFFITSLFLLMTTFDTATAQHPLLDFATVKAYEHQLDDVMELVDTVVVKNKLKEVEAAHAQYPSEINRVRLGIIYHETALNLSFFSKTEFKGYAQKSFDTLSKLVDSPHTTVELLPFISSYRASALSLVGAETKSLKSVGEAFVLFEEAVNQYAAVSYAPEFLRGSVAENLPWLFFKKRKFAKKDFSSIIDRQERNENYANAKVMSFTYWAWANQRQSKKYRTQALAYLDQAIALDPDYKAGRAKAEELKNKLSK